MLRDLASAAFASVLAVGLASVAAAQPQAPFKPFAFPGAEGAGRFSLGGRGGAVLRITNLKDSGPGSLRAAVEADGPRTIVFDIGGTIRLTSPLTIRHGRITLAGQTAPGGGITIRDQPLIVAADDVVVRFIRVRLGDESGVEADALSVTRGRRIVIDHVSTSWSIDETLSAGARTTDPEDGVHDLTVSWSIIAESLNASGHAKGDHGYGSLLRGGFGAQMTFHHNLWASHRARMPRPGNYNPPAVDPEGPRFEFRNNVFYNWGGARAGYNADTETRSTYAFVANAYVPGPDSTGRWAFKESSSLAQAWFADNAMDGAVPADPWSLVENADRPGYRLSARPVWADAASDTPAEALKGVLSNSGASHAYDPVDLRILAGVRDRSGRITDSQSQVGAWPDLAPGAPWIDTDRDGLPDAWETAQALDPADPLDAALDPDGDGFTNLEDWLNYLVKADLSS
jgi:hypothetical protein